MICIKCKTDRPETDFAWKKKTEGIKSKTCKLCHREYAKKNYQENIERDRAKCKRNKQITKKIRREMVDSIKVMGCKECGDDRLPVLDFHHSDPTQKEFHITTLIGMSQARFEEELEKCVVLCANCHRMEHHRLS